ncbi:MAG: hypothetical protein H0X25_05625 [Acidobacteriales bacterium]|nr:hypothetical protein [Terriglobales bacterium]
MRETDPAVRALTESGDALPLLRLIAENEVASASGGPGSIPELNSNGLFLAVSCQDYPQIYDMRSRFAERILGTTYAGGATGLGTVFNMDASGAITLLHSFAGYSMANPAGSDGANPQGRLIQGTDGNLYGTASNGGSSCDIGVIFRLLTQALRKHR